MVTYGEARFLLIGDMAEAGEAALLAGDAPLSSSVLEVPAYGDASLSGDEFLAAVGPQVVIVPRGSEATTPDDATLARLAATGARVYRTDRDGIVHIASDGARLWVWPRAPR